VKIMPDGDRPFRPLPPRQGETSSQSFFNLPPGVTNPAGGVARALNFAKGMSRKAFVLVGVVAVAQWGLPENWKPSTIIGSFHGNTESAELKAKQPATTEFERKVADAKAQAATRWQMEAEVFRQQQEATAKSLETLETAAQIADAACLGAPLATLFMGDTPQARDIQRTMQAACAEAIRIRAQISRIQVESARAGSALVNRSTAGGSP
jgi:hypothetical protein